VKTDIMPPKVPEKTIREIADKIAILDVVSPCVSLTRAGRHYKGLCPFHPDKNPSFIVNPERNTFHCFGCGTGGDAYSFFMKFHNVPFMHAVQELARQAGIDLEFPQEKKDTRKEETQRLGVELNRQVSNFYQEILLEDPGADLARTYLQKRGIGPNTSREFSIGFAPNDWDRLSRHLIRTPSSLQLATLLGLIQPRKSGRGYYDRFRNRVIFPISGTTGQILAFGGRTLDPEGPKYINSSESFLYKKGSVLYGLQQAQSHIRRTDCVILVEGYMDLITLHQNDFHNAVAVLGTSLTMQQMQILKRYSRQFLFLFDGDDAGIKASFRTLPDILEQGILARAVYLPPEHDPDSFLRTEGKDALQARIDESSPLLDRFIIQQTESLKNRDSVEEKVVILRKILPILVKIPDQLEQQLRIRAVSHKIGIEERSLWEEFGKYKNEKRIAPHTPTERCTGSANQWPPEERLVCQVLIQFPALSLQLIDPDALEYFSNTSLKDLVQAIAIEYRKRGALNLPELLSRQEDPEVARLLTGLSCREEFSEPEATTALGDSLRRIRKKNLQARLTKLNQEIREAETLHKNELRNKLFLEKQKLLNGEKARLP
jgi:DNA primase